MTDAFLGEVVLMGFGFAPKGFANCDGQLMQVNQNQALFSLFGTSYGGDGMRSFGLPDLRGRTPVGGFASADPAWQPATYGVGMQGGVEWANMGADELPAHTHRLSATKALGTSNNPEGRLFAMAGVQSGGAAPIYVAVPDPALVPLDSSVISASGGDQPHPNMQPFQTINFCVCIGGGFPPR